MGTRPRPNPESKVPFAGTERIVANSLLDVVIRGDTAHQGKSIKAAAMWMLTAIIPFRIQPFIHAKISFSKNLRDREGIYGDCCWTDRNHKPRHFEYRLDNRQSPGDLFLTLAHECIHLKQWATGELFDYARDANISRWRNKRVLFDKTTYDQLPWEIEAYRLDYPLVCAWRRSLRYQENNL
jgi:hypothetical protein